MRRLVLVALIFVLNLNLPAAFAQKADPVLQPLTFLAGHWTSDTPEAQEEEYWSQAIGRSMVGTYRLTKAGDAVFYEFWVIEMSKQGMILGQGNFTSRPTSAGKKKTGRDVGFPRAADCVSWLATRVGSTCVPAAQCRRLLRPRGCETT